MYLQFPIRFLPLTLLLRYANWFSFNAIKLYICVVVKIASYLEDLGFIYRTNTEMGTADLRFALFSFQIAASTNVRNDSYNCIWNNTNIFAVLRIIATNSDIFRRIRLLILQRINLVVKAILYT